MILASLTSQITGAIADNGAYAVFGLMFDDALLPVGSKLVMLYAGALGAGAIAGKHATLFGAHLAAGSRALTCSWAWERSAIWSAHSSVGESVRAAAAP